jgi:hypothetical protein
MNAVRSPPFLISDGIGYCSLSILRNMSPPVRSWSLGHAQQPDRVCILGYGTFRAEVDLRLDPCDLR